MATTTINNLNLNNIKAIVFDWDGTLFNNVPAIKAATRSVLEQFNIVYPEEESINEFMALMENIQDNNLPAILLKHYKLLNNIPYIRDLSYLQKLQILFMIYSKYKQYSAVSQLYTGTKELLEYLAQKFDLVIFSSSKREEVIQALEKFGILSYFKSIFTLEDVKYPKPHPEGIQKLIQKLNYHPRNVLYVGDSALDILTARAANIPSVAISTGLIPKQDLMAYSPNLICDHITDLSSLFDLPKISVDKALDQRTIDYHAEKIKSYVKEEFNFFTLLQAVLPPEIKFEAKQIGRIIQDPLGFIGAILQDGITKYTRGEIELKRQFTEFIDNEEDLLRCLGLIIIHFVNERSNNLMAKLIRNPLTKLPSMVTSMGLKLSYQYLYPNDYKERFRTLFLKLFGKIIPNESLARLQELDATTFTNAVINGCELALYDLGIPKIRNLEFKPIKPLALSFSSMILKIPTMLVHTAWKRINEISQDILENDFRRYPGE